MNLDHVLLQAGDEDRTVLARACLDGDRPRLLDFGVNAWEARPQLRRPYPGGGSALIANLRSPAEIAVSFTAVMRQSRRW